MISIKELSYVNSWANRVPYPGLAYSEEAMQEMIDSFNLYKDKYRGRSYNITFSNNEEIEMEILHKNIAHMLGIDSKSIQNEYFAEFRKNVLGLDPRLNQPTFSLLSAIIENADKVLEYDNKTTRGRVLNYYKLRVKSRIFQKITDFSKFDFACINFDKAQYISVSNNESYSSNSEKFLFVPSNEPVAPYFLMGIKREIEESDSEGKSENYQEQLKGSSTYIVETLIAPENPQDFFNNQEVIIPTQLLYCIDDELTKLEASPEEKIRLFNMYKTIIGTYSISDRLNISGDYISLLTLNTRYDRRL